MRIGFIGLGKMGSQMVQRLSIANHEVVVYDVNPESVNALTNKGVIAAPDRKSLVSQLSPVIVWLMIPSQFVDEEIEKLLEIVPEGSIIIDGGNSDFRLTQKRAEICANKSVTLIDVGTSGGILGFKNGFSMMVGGELSAVNTLEPIFEALAQEGGWKHFGSSGSGHYVKMVHNAIEYGLMESYAEGYRMLRDGPYKDLDLSAAGEVWKHGSIISSLLNDLIVDVLNKDSNLSGVDGFVAESGEARWTLETAKELGINLPTIESAYQVRVDSQAGNINYATKLLAAMRNKFGGHAINKDQK